MSISKTSSTLLHVAAWLCLLVFPILLNQLDKENGDAWDIFHLGNLLIPVFYMGIFYLNVYVLFPRFYLGKKYLLYGASVVLLLVVVLAVRPFDQMQNPGSARRPPSEGHMPAPAQTGHPGPPPGGKHHFDILGLFVFLMVIGTGTAFGAIKEWQLTEKRAILAETERAKAEADRANAELSFLKAQINPHFLYNTLNNIYSFAVNGSEKAPIAILKLSSIMRYVTDEAEADFVPLEGELECIDNFVELQKLRLGKKVRLNYHVNGNKGGQVISPLILMTFIENAFKYGLSNHQDAPIEILIEISPGKINFHTSNRIFDHKKKIARQGLGISNTRRRLEHLYPGRYALKIDEQNGFFTVDLSLQM